MAGTTRESNALERCAHECGARAWRLALSLMRNRADAEDVVQQAFVVAARKAERIPAHDPWPWFATIVTFEARNARRKRRPSEENAVQVDRNNDPSHSAERREFVERLHRELEGLEEAQRDAIVLTQLSGLSYGEAAKALEQPAGTVKSNVHRGIERLRLKLGSEPSTVTQALATLPVLDPVGGLDKALLTWVGTAKASVATGILSSGSVVAGGMVMANKIVAGCALAIGIGLGIVGTVVVPELVDTDPTDLPVIETGESEAGQLGQYPVLASSDAGEIERLRSELGRARAELSAKSAKIDDLTRESQPTSTPEHKPPKTGESEASSPPNKNENESSSSADVLALDGWYPQDTFKDIDWGQVAQGAMRLGQLISLSSEQITAREWDDINLLGNQILALRKSLHDRFHTNTKKQDTSLSHPFVIVNVFAAILQTHGKPFISAQLAQLEDIGKRYEEGVQLIAQKGGDNTPVLSRILDELELRQSTLNSIIAALSWDQKEILYNPTFGAPAGLIAGPLHDLRNFTKGQSAESEEALSSAIISNKILASEWKLPLELAIQCQYIANQWFDAIRKDISSGAYDPNHVLQSGNDVITTTFCFAPAGPGETFDKQCVEFEKLLRFGRAQVRAMEEVLRTPLLPKENVTLLTNWEQIAVFTFTPAKLDQPELDQPD